MQPPWRIELLGDLRVVHDNRVITRFRSQKTGLLLASLAYYLPRPQRREQLAELLWPESDPSTALANLRNTLRWLRQELEPPGVPAGTVLLADRATLQLNSDAVTTDVIDFEAALAAAARVENGEERVHRLTQAVALYRGELLPGCFEDWVLQERQWLAERYFQALGELVSHLEQAGEFERALAYARRGVRADPLREEAHRDLIRMQAAAGQPEAALRQYEELERRLARELADEPSAELRALAATLRQPGSLVSPSLAPEPSLAPVAAAPESRLPLPLDRFFGRRSELARLIALLRPLTAAAGGDEEPVEASAPPRLITLTGPGGSGKTRLALEVARRLQPRSRAPIWFVPLQGLTPAAATEAGGAARRPPILEEVRDAMGLPRTSGAVPLEQVVTALGQQPALLILDNFEHLVEGGAPLIQALLQRVATLTILVTSRRRLNLPGEREMPIPPLPVPVPVDGHSSLMDDLTRTSLSLSEPSSPLASRVSDRQRSINPSVALFLDRAQAVRPDLALTPGNAGTVAAVCARLEGLPLALELAAARAGVLTPEQMLARLSSRFELLTTRQRLADPRHRSLRATLDWSYQLLPPELQRFFARLSVFRGGWALEAAETVCGEEGALHAARGARDGHSAPVLEYLEQLRECSLVVAEAAGEVMRYRLLETLREYTAEQLPAAEQAALAGRHASYFLAEAERGRPSPDQGAWFRRADAEHDNYRAALQWGLQTDAELALRLAVALQDFWFVWGYWAEGQETLERALQRGVGASAAVRASALSAAGWLTRRLGKYERARELLEESVALFRALGDRVSTARALTLLGQATTWQGDLAGGRALMEESLTINREMGSQSGIAWSLKNLSGTAWQQGEVEAAQAFSEEALPLFRECDAQGGIADTLLELGRYALARGDHPRALPLLEESLTIAREIGNRDTTALCLHFLCAVALEAGDLHLARACIEESIALFRILGERARLIRQVEMLAHVAAAEGNASQAARLFGAFSALREAAATSSFFCVLPDSESTVTAVRTTLGTEAFAAAWAEGQAMSLEQALASALENGRIQPAEGA